MLSHGAGSGYFRRFRFLLDRWFCSARKLASSSAKLIAAIANPMSQPTNYATGDPVKMTIASVTCSMTASYSSTSPTCFNFLRLLFTKNVRNLGRKNEQVIYAI